MAVSVVEQEDKLAGGQSQLGGPPVSYDADLERLEIELLLAGIFQRYGFDFRAYAHASLRRRLWKRVEAERLTTISALQARVLHDPAALDRMLLDLSVNVTSMFRDPGFYKKFREIVVSRSASTRFQSRRRNEA